jgi:glycosyltransferase involved in cell wall biosynthesis
MYKLKISVIIPVFNGDVFIGRCLRSIIDQTVPRCEYEIIVVNDGSTDLTKYALGLFRDEIKIITNIKNIGLPASLNKGIKKSQGEYIIRVDSDDYVNSNLLNFLLYYLESNRECDAVACDYLTVDDDENVIKRANSINEHIACGIMFRKEQLFEIGLYDERFRLHEDIDLRIRFEKKYHITNLPLPLYRYRKHSKNITNNKDGMTYYLNKLSIKHNLAKCV